MEESKPTNENLEDILIKTNEDFSNFEITLSKDAAELAKELQSTSQELKASYEALRKQMDKSMDEVVSSAEKEVFQFYHDNKSTVDKDLNAVNTHINSVLKSAREGLNYSMRASKDPVERAALQAALLKVVDISRAYNFKFRALKMRLAFENAGINIKDAFKNLGDKFSG